MHASNPFAAPRRDEPERPEQPPEDDDDVVPVLDIWFRPRATIRWLIRERPGHRVFLISTLLGVVHMSDLPVIDSPAKAVSVLFAVVVLNGWLATLVTAAVLTGFGRLMDGTGNYFEVLTAYCWGSAPSTLLLGGFALFLFDLDALDPTLFMAIAGLYVAVAALITLWNLAWQSIAMAEAHRFGLLQGFTTVFVPRLLWWTGILLLGFAALGWLEARGLG